MNTMMRTRNIDQWSYVDFGTRRTTACHRECHKPCSSRARVSERIGHPRDAMGSQLISCTALLLARIHEITAADYSYTFALLARRPLLDSFAVPAYVRLVIRHVVLWLLPASALLFAQAGNRSEEHTSELQSRGHLVCRLLLEKKNIHYPETLTGLHHGARHIYI